MLEVFDLLVDMVLSERCLSAATAYEARGIVRTECGVLGVPYPAPYARVVLSWQR